MNPNLEQLARETKNPSISLEVKAKEADGYVWVPGIQLYVSRKLTGFDKSFRDNLDDFLEMNAHMLTPAQWWEFYDYMNGQQLFFGITSEMMNAVVDPNREKFLVEPFSGVSSKNWSYECKGLHNFSCFGERYAFNREDVDEITGMPRYRKSGEFCFRDFEKNRFAMVSIGAAAGNFRYDMHLTGTDVVWKDVGVRPCYQEDIP
jgi:hypothetical protein